MRVEAGDLVSIEHIEGEPGDQVELDDVLLIGGDAMGPKLRIFKHKRRKRYRLHKGHRQGYTCIKIDSIKV